MVLYTPVMSDRRPIDLYLATQIAKESFAFFLRL